MLFGRIEELHPQLERWCAQTYCGQWELIFWNNQYSRAVEIDSIIALFRNRLNIKVIHSDHNYHCMARMAVAALANGELVFMVDDDVIPQPSYLTTFVSTYDQVASTRENANFAICACGHQFGREATGASASEVWEDRQGLQFLDQTAPSIEVDFAHGNNFMISRGLFLQASAFKMPHLQFGLVDDYWLSYVLSHFLKTTIITGINNTNPLNFKLKHNNVKAIPSIPF